jgi:hypothetical protein
MGSRRRTGRSARTALRHGLVPLALLLLVALPASAGAALPDGRAYELVSPAQKLGTDVIANANVEPTAAFPTPLTATSGNAVEFSAFDGLPGGTSNGFVNSFRATRTAAGWTTQQLDPVLESAPSITASIVKALDPGLGSYLQAGPSFQKQTPDALEGAGNLYLHEGSGYRLVTVGALDTGLSAEPLAHSQDLRHIVFTANERLGTEGPSAVAPFLYDWSAATGKPTLVGRLPDNSFSTEPIEIARPPQTGDDFNRWNQVSKDGSHVFFVTAPNSPEQQLFVRLNGTQTKQVSESHRNPADPEKRAATFRFASADGAHAFFTSAAKLTSDATTGPADSGEDLYRYDAASGALTDLAVDAADANGAQVQGVLGGGSDGASLYFVAKGKLATGATAGALNLYRWSDNGSAKGLLTFIAAGVNPANWEADTATFAHRIPARVTPDGQHLLFESTASLTGYPNAGHYEAYLFTVGAPLLCATCNPKGTAATADALAVGTSGDAGAFSHTLSEDGHRVFFISTEKLVAADVNAVADTYEYDAVSKQISLLSAGTGAFPSLFADATPSGGDVDFLTRDRLVGIDEDQNYDVYDARIGGGIAAQNPPPTPAPCLEAACRGPLPVVPAALAPHSSAATEGNTPAPSPPKKKKKKHHKKKHKHHKAAAKHREARS